MFSVDNFYDYLTYNYSKPLKNNIVYRFAYPGCRDLFQLGPSKLFDKIEQLQLHKLYGGLFLFDDEPINFDYYYFEIDNIDTETANRVKFIHENLSKPEQILNSLSRMRTPIIMHSEKNSEEINFFHDHGLLSVHYWYHGLISIDWFRQWKHYQKKNILGIQRFGCYIRDTSGSREYRKQLLDFIKTQESIFCPALNNQLVDSNSSANIVWDDVENFSIQIVAETLFESKKTHLTEKVLKPIVMEQPFILFAGPNSLDYIKNYGFKTFNDLWDESYDQEVNHKKRFDKIISLIEDLNKLNSREFKSLMTQALLITKYNKQHFYSNKFESRLLAEMHNGIDQALLVQEENFLTDPGGSWLQNLNLIYTRTGNINPLKKYFLNSMHYLKIQDPTSADKIIKKYNHLF